MIEQLKLNVIYFLLFCIPVIAYWVITKILLKSFRKTPDDPLFSEEKGGKTIRVLKKVVSAVLIIAVVACGASVLYKLFAGGDFDAQQQAIIDEYEALNEDNVNPQTGKTILTQAFLEKEYKLYALNDNWDTGYQSILYKAVFAGLLLVAGGVSCVDYVISFYIQKKKVNILSIVASVLLIPVIVIAFSIIDDKFGPNRLPDPDTAKIYTSTVTIKSLREKTTHDEETGDHSSYYVTIDYGDGKDPVSKKIPLSVYDSLESDHTYFLGQAEEKGKKCEFNFYSPEEFEEE